MEIGFIPVSFLLSFACPFVLDLGDVAPVEKTLYLKPQADFWDQANARFEAYTFAGEKKYVV